MIGLNMLNEAYGESLGREYFSGTCVDVCPSCSVNEIDRPKYILECRSSKFEQSIDSREQITILRTCYQNASNDDDCIY